ncbi:MAG TPA: SLC13 family permease [Gammaproteobacteria bacterium]|nr:SLC13 family permease [Gammaproteobacteria bacterium]
MASLSWHALAAIAVTVGALVLFTRARVPIERSCIVVLLTLIAGFEIFPYRSSMSATELRGIDFLAGLSNEALITICLLLIAAKGLEVTGALRPLGSLLMRLWSRNRSIALLSTLLITATLSAFVNNTPIVVMVMPVLISVAHRIGMAPSRVLMPFCFATTIGGMTTTIGSSTNLLVVDAAEQLENLEIGMFDFMLPALVAAIPGILFLWLVAPRLLGDRPSPLTRPATGIFEAAAVVRADSRLVDGTLGELMRAVGEPTRIERVQRGALALMRLPSLKLREGDIVHARGSAEAIHRMLVLLGGESARSSLQRGADQRLIEIVVTRSSGLYGKRFSEVRDATLGKLVPIGIQLPGAREPKSLDEAGNPRLAIGDVLLLQGRAQDLNAVRSAHEYLVLSRSLHIDRTAAAGRAAVIVGTALLAAALGVLSIVVSAFAAVGLLLFTRCLSWEEAWGAIDKRLVLFLVTALALGTALARTGAAELIAAQLVTLAIDYPAPLVLSGLLLVIMLLNELLSNNAVAVICTPIAIGIAEQLGAPVLPFVLAVLFGANAGYVTPMGYQTNLLVYTAGGYSFTDFVRVGLPLQLLTWLILSVTLAMLYF